MWSQLSDDVQAWDSRPENKNTYAAVLNIIELLQARSPPRYTLASPAAHAPPSAALSLCPSPSLRRHSRSSARTAPAPHRRTRLRRRTSLPPPRACYLSSRARSRRIGSLRSTYRRPDARSSASMPCKAGRSGSRPTRLRRSGRA